MTRSTTWRRAPSARTSSWVSRHASRPSCCSSFPSSAGARGSVCSPPTTRSTSIQEAPPEEREKLIAALDRFAQREVHALLAYAEDDAGGLMSPRYTRVRPDMSVDEAISYVRRQAPRAAATGHYVYVTDETQRLLGVLSFRELFAAARRGRASGT